MSKEQTFRSEDNAFLPLRRRQLSVRCVTSKTNGGSEPSTQKDFETEHPGVFAAPGSPLAHFFNCGIRDQKSVIDVSLRKGTASN